MNILEGISAPPVGDTQSRIAAQLGALAHPARIQILQHISGCGACCCKDVVDRLDLAQSTVSQHLKVLVQAGLVQMGAEGQRSRYEADRGAIAELSQAVGGLLATCCAPHRNE